MVIFPQNSNSSGFFVFLSCFFDSRDAERGAGGRYSKAGKERDLHAGCVIELSGDEARTSECVGVKLFLF